MYANSRFVVEVNEWGRVTKEVMPGDKVSQSDLGMGDDEWKALIDRGLVLKSYPKDLSPDTPLAEYYKENPDELEEAAPEKAAEPAKAQTAQAPQAPQASQASQTGTSQQESSK